MSTISTDVYKVVLVVRSVVVGGRRMRGPGDRDPGLGRRRLGGPLPAGLPAAARLARA